MFHSSNPAWCLCTDGGNIYQGAGSTLKESEVVAKSSAHPSEESGVCSIAARAPRQDYLLDGIQHGFRIGFKHTQHSCMNKEEHALRRGAPRGGGKIPGKRAKVRWSASSSLR